MLLLVLLDEEDVEHLLLALHAVVHGLIWAVAVKPKSHKIRNNTTKPKNLDPDD